jgi:hypothetical protein
MQVATTQKTIPPTDKRKKMMSKFTQSATLLHLPGVRAELDASGGFLIFVC